MMKSKIIICIAIAASLAACKKYPDGPSVSIRTRTERVSHTTWKMEKVLENGSDVTSFYTGINYLETYAKDGTFTYSSTGGSGTGKWAFENKDTQIKRNGVNGQSSDDITILELKQTALWYKFTDGNDTYEFHLVPNK